MPQIPVVKISSGKGWLAILLLFCSLGFGEKASWGQEPTIAVFYGAHPPWQELQAFQVVVVEPDHGFDPQQYRTNHSELFAYVSLGEVLNTKPYFPDIPASWILGKNDAWQSQIIDQTQPDWAQFVLKQLIDPLWHKGYRGFFLDTLDSYQLAAKDPESSAKQKAGLIGVIRAIKYAHPDAKLLFNRGFEVIPDIPEFVYAMAVESVFQSWDPLSKQFMTVPPALRDGVLQQMIAFRDRYHFPMVIIDYLPLERREEARALAKKIIDLGFIPWVTTPNLDALGVGGLEVMPRKVLVLFDGRQHPDVARSEVHRFLDFPLQYLGLIPEHWDVREGFPDYSLVGRYAGIVSWLPGLESPLDERLHHWIVQQVKHKVPVVFLESFGFPYRNDLLSEFNLTVGGQLRGLEHIRAYPMDPMVGSEILPVPDRQHFFPFNNVRGRTLLKLSQGRGVEQDAIGLTEWGGYALHPFPLIPLLEGQGSRWVVEPIQFFKQALQLLPMPIPETTTRNGQRLFFVHVDGDGFPSRVEFGREEGDIKFAGELLLEDVLKRYEVPTTVSIIEGEIAKHGLYPQWATRLEQVAQRIFALPYVEIASHSFSHPFAWQSQNMAGLQKPHLAIPGYRFDGTALEREIVGSANYINAHLAPPNKSTQVFLWTGDCNPSPEALRIASTHGLATLNGGDTIITDMRKSLTAVAPLGIQKGPFLQVYAPNQNENMYTNLWTGPFYGYQQVIETFQLTEKPRRLKPINMYFHTYSASKRASLTALHTVYDWALAQPINPLYASEYVALVQDFYRMVVGRSAKGWHLFHLQATEEVRVPQELGFPDLEKSDGVIGYVDTATDRYIHVDPSHAPVLTFGSAPNQAPYLVKTNGKVVSWQRTTNTLEMEVVGHIPLTAEIEHVKNCHVVQGNALAESTQQGSRISLRFKAAPHVMAKFVCR